MKTLVMPYYLVMGILNIDFGNNNLDETSYNEDDHDTIILIRLFSWYIKFEKRKALKKELKEELMEIVWHFKRCWDSCMLEDEPIFTE